jgi:urea transport system permease protein
MNDRKAAILRELLKTEKDKRVREIMQTGIALRDLYADDQATRLEAIRVLSESLDTKVMGKLRILLEKDSQGAYLEPDAIIRDAANRAARKIESSREFFGFVETAFFGLSLGSVLLLIAIGLAITFGVMGVINMAHGELMMLGAYTTYVVQQLMPNYIDYSLFVAIPAAFLVAALFGIAIERGIIRHLYGRPLETLLATFGISLILQQMVRSIFSPLNRSVSTPSWMSGSWEINSALSLTYNRLYIIIFSLLVFGFLVLLLKKTVLGLQVRAVSQNRNMAKAMGVRSEWVDALTFGLGSGIAGVAGVALSQLTNVGPNLGQAYIVDSFMVVVFGGVGNLWGTLVGAMSLGVVNKFMEPWVGAVLAKILILVFIILFIQKKPRGLFPQKGRAAEN